MIELGMFDDADILFFDTDSWYHYMVPHQNCRPDVLLKVKQSGFLFGFSKPNLRNSKLSLFTCMSSQNWRLVFYLSDQWENDAYNVCSCKVIYSINYIHMCSISIAIKSFWGAPNLKFFHAWDYYSALYWRKSFNEYKTIIFLATWANNS